MDWPRVHAFEFNDQPWAPPALRESIVETLSLALRIGGQLRGLVPPIRAVLDASGATEILDLCGGAGGPARILTHHLAANGGAVPIVVTDLQPHVDAWTALSRELPSVSFVPEPVDATQIPADLGRSADGRPRLRVVMNALHHFRPDLARGIFADAVRSRAPILVSELFGRNPFHFLSFAPAALAALALLPIVTPKERAKKVALHWLTPATFLAGGWDALVSTLRMYTDAELRDLVAPFGEGYEWRSGTFAYAPLGRGRYFCGWPRRK